MPRSTAGGKGGNLWEAKGMNNTNQKHEDYIDEGMRTS